MDITTFENLLVSTPPHSSSTRSSTDIVGLLEDKNFASLEETIPQLSKKEINTTAVMMALVQNFNSDIAEMLCEKGLDLKRLTEARCTLACAPTVEFWEWFVASNAASSELCTGIFAEAFRLLYSAVPSDDPRRTSSAQYALIFYAHQPKLCQDTLKDICLEELVCNKHFKNINPIQWDMLRECVHEKSWKEVLFEIDPCGVKDFEQLVHWCKQVPSLNAAYNAYFDTSQKMYEWKIENLASPTGNIKDCVLITSLPSEQRSNAVKVLRTHEEKSFSLWGMSEVDRIVLGGRDPSAAHETSKSKIQQNLLQSAGYHHFLHMMMGQMGAGFSKAVHQTPEVEQQIVKTLDLLDVHMFIELSSSADLAALFKKFPKTLEWTDIAGNHLGHYIADNSHSFFNVFEFLVKNPSLRRPNPSGVSPRALLHNQGCTPSDLSKCDEMMSKYDKKVLQQSLKSLPEVVLKVRSRKTATRKI